MIANRPNRASSQPPREHPTNGSTTCSRGDVELLPLRSIAHGRVVGTAMRWASQVRSALEETCKFCRCLPVAEVDRSRGQGHGLHFNITIALGFVDVGSTR